MFDRAARRIACVVPALNSGDQYGGAQLGNVVVQIVLVVVGVGVCGVRHSILHGLDQRGVQGDVRVGT